MIAWWEYALAVAAFFALIGLYAGLSLAAIVWRAGEDEADDIQVWH